MSSILFWFMSQVNRLEEIEKRQKQIQSDQLGQYAKSDLCHEIERGLETAKADFIGQQPNLSLEGLKLLPEHIRVVAEQCLTTLRNEMSDAYSGLETSRKALNFVSNSNVISYRQTQHDREVSSRENAIRRIRSSFDMLTQVTESYMEQLDVTLVQKETVQLVLKKLEHCIQSFERK